MSELNYIPSWLDSAMTLLEKLNKCIEKIETIVNNVITVTKTANDALSLANTNESNITELQNKTTALETKTTTLETNVDAASQEARGARSLAQLALDTGNTAQAIANSKSPKLYLHEITLNTSSNPQFGIKFWAINEESMSYKSKFASEVEFSATLRPFNAILLSKQGQSTSACLTLEISDISLSHHKNGTSWNSQNCNGSIDFAAYLDNSNQIVAITDNPEWYAATVDSDYVIEL